MGSPLQDVGSINLSLKGSASIEFISDHVKRARGGAIPAGGSDAVCFVEAHNKTMRMHMRRFTRLTNGHIKKVANHAHMVVL